MTDQEELRAEFEALPEDVTAAYSLVAEHLRRRDVPELTNNTQGGNHAR